MYKVMVVAAREYLVAVKSKAFIITIMLMPLMMGGGFIAERFFGDAGVDVRDRRIAIIDHSGQLFDDLAAAAELRNAVEIYDPSAPPDQPKQIASRFILEKVDPSADPNETLLSLSERVRNGDLFAFVEIAPDVVDAPEGDEDHAAIRYYSNAPTYKSARNWLSARVNAAVRERRFEQSGLDEEKVDWATQSASVDELGLLTRDEETGQVVHASEVDKVSSVLIPALLVVLLFMVIMMAAGPLIQSVLEEKMQRIAEVLLGCIDPSAWMFGKLLGMVGVSFTIVAVYLIGGIAVAADRGMLHIVPTHMLGWFIAYQILAVLMYGAVFVGIGAACSDHREAQTALTPMMVFIMLPMLLLQNVVREPNSTMATVLSLIPPITPVLMLTRQAIPPGVPAWQPIVGIVLVLITTLLSVFAAGRVFRVGILMQGQGAKLRDVVQWVIRG